MPNQLGSGICPHRWRCRCHTRSDSICVGMDENVTYYEDTMPADLYYACLDGPYNYDNDGYWGEPHDGTDGGDVDLIADVYVGRACVGSTAEVNNFVTKTVAYINRDINDPYLKKIYLAAEYLGVTVSQAMVEHIWINSSMDRPMMDIPPLVYLQMIT